MPWRVQRKAEMKQELEQIEIGSYGVAELSLDFRNGVPNCDVVITTPRMPQNILSRGFLDIQFWCQYTCQVDSYYKYLQGKTSMA